MGRSGDDSGRIGAVVNAKGDRIGHSYTAQDQTFANPLNAEEVAFTFHNLTQVDYPVSTFEIFGHDARGNVTSCTERTGQSWSYTYNDRGLMLTEVNPAQAASGPSPSTTTGVVWIRPATTTASLRYITSTTPGTF